MMGDDGRMYLTLTHAGGSSRPCEVMGIENKVVGRARTPSATAIRVRFGVAGIYEVNPHTGAVKSLEGGWKADPTECARVIQAWGEKKA